MPKQQGNGGDNDKFAIFRIECRLTLLLFYLAQNLPGKQKRK